jgi:hypothetical protein
MLTVALDGSEDHMGRGDAARFWAECGMTSKRASALADVNARWSDGSISWERHRELLQEFPRRGQLDVYAEGQEDEGTHSGPQAWSDREDPSEDEDDTHVLAFAEAGPPLSDQQRLQLGDVAERMRQVDDMIAIARSHGNAHIVMTLEQARHTLLRQSSEARLMDPVVFSAARELRLRQEEQLLAERKRCTGARAALRVHSAGAAAILPIAGSCAMVKKERMRLRLRRQEKSNGTVDFDTASKGFDAAVLGQDRKHAGGVVYRKNRLDLLMRVSRHFPALTGKIQEDWMRNFRLWDAQNSRRYSAAWGHVFRDKMRALLQAQKMGQIEALQRFAVRVAREVPSAEICA